MRNGINIIINLFIENKVKYRLIENDTLRHKNMQIDRQWTGKQCD